MNSEAEESEEVLGGSKKLTTDEIIAQGIVLILAGYETSSTTLQFLVYEISQRPEVQEKLVEEIAQVVGDTSQPSYSDCQNLKYMEAVILETLRHYPPLHFITRH